MSKLPIGEALDESIILSSRVMYNTVLFSTTGNEDSNELNKPVIEVMITITAINVHMAIPVSCAIELGRVWMPKPHKTLVLYDYRNNKENETITIKDN